MSPVKSQAVGPPRSRWRPWGSAIVTAVIIGLLMVPGPAVPSVGFDGIDFIAHVILFGSWGFLLRWEFGLSVRALLLAAVAFALATELLQTLAIERTFSLLDIAADVTGAILGWACAAMVIRPSLQAGE